MAESSDTGFGTFDVSDLSTSNEMETTREYAEWTKYMNENSGTINVFGLSLQTMKKKVSIPPAYMNSMRLAVEKY